MCVISAIPDNPLSNIYQANKIFLLNRVLWKHTKGERMLFLGTTKDLAIMIVIMVIVIIINSNISSRSKHSWIV